MIKSSLKNISNRFNSAQDSLVIQAADMSLETIAAMVDVEAIDVQPLYQRRDRWNLAAKSALIESFLLNIPVPPVYLAEENFGTYSVIDGKQRLTAIKQFMRNEFPLKNLDRFVELENLKFSQLPPDLQNALKIRPYVRVVTLLKQSDPELKYEVFTRLNTGGIALHPQEIRNAMYRGEFNDLLIELSASPFLRRSLKISSLNEDVYKTMADVEYVLRFFTMNETWFMFSGEYRKSMDLFMSAHRLDTKNALKKFESDFITSIQRCSEIWGECAFKRYDPETDVFRDQFLSAVYDAQMVAVAQLSEDNFQALIGKKARIIEKTKTLFTDKAFDSAIRLSTNTPSKVRYRIESVINLLETV